MEVFAFLLIFLIRNNQNFIIVPHSKLTKKVLDSPQEEVNRKPCLRLADPKAEPRGFFLIKSVLQKNFH